MAAQSARRAGLRRAPVAALLAVIALLALTPIASADDLLILNGDSVTLSGNQNYGLVYIDGGLVLAGPSAARTFPGLKPMNQHPHPRFDIFSLGQGRVALARAPFDDPWTLANDAHLLTSKRYDPVRLFNGGLLHTHTASSPDLAAAIVHIVNYGGEAPGHEVVLQVGRPVKSARFHDPRSASPKAVTLTGNPARPEMVLPDFSVYIAVELEYAHA